MSILPKNKGRACRPPVLGIDASRANEPNRTGVGWYAFHVIQDLKKLIPSYHRVLLYSREPLRDGLEELPPNWESRVLRWPPKRLWTQARLSWEMLVRPPDLLFVPAHALPLILPRASVTTLHDVSFMVTPRAYGLFERWYQRWAVRHASRRSRAVLTVSEFSKSEITRYFATDPKKIFVTHLGFDAEVFRPLDDAEIGRVISKYGISRPYFIFVGRLEAKKNLSGLLRAFAEFRENGGAQAGNFSLVLVGGRGVGYDREVRRARLNQEVKERVIECGYADKADMPFLVAGATALIQPSWYEGFGLPPIEAMACGTPVISSNVTSLPEVCGYAAMYANPGKPEEFAQAMSRVTKEPALLAELVRNGLKHAKQFTWRRTAEKTWEVLKKHLAGRCG
jgi:glycosyltransferase involved in cell wall biosynthesis